MIFPKPSLDSNFLISLDQFPPKKLHLNEHIVLPLHEIVNPVEWPDFDWVFPSPRWATQRKFTQHKANAFDRPMVFPWKHEPRNFPPSLQRLRHANSGTFTCSEWRCRRPSPGRHQDLERTPLQSPQKSLQNCHAALTWLPNSLLSVTSSQSLTTHQGPISCFRPELKSINCIHREHCQSLESQEIKYALSNTLTNQSAFFKADLKSRLLTISIASPYLKPLQKLSLFSR